ncbi:unnamed protein product [Durusdinium trenchii]|uniref:Uncharacterized protein n=1 Tax=Durusdinium trenchii TaxID=1381693 RepID=A0ABP0LMG1_9DINO
MFDFSIRRGASRQSGTADPGQILLLPLVSWRRKRCKVNFVTCIINKGILVDHRERHTCASPELQHRAWTRRQVATGVSTLEWRRALFSELQSDTARPISPPAPRGLVGRMGHTWRWGCASQVLFSTCACTARQKQNASVY